MTYVASPPPGTITRVAAGNTGAPRVAADGGVVVWPEKRNGHMAIMKYDHGTVTQISEDGYDCTNPALSADGSTCVYARLTPEHDGIPANFDIYKNQDGENIPVATTPNNEYSTAISHDGSTIAWDDDMGSMWMRWRVGKSQDGAISYLSDGKFNAECPFIAGDSNRVFFVESNGARHRISGEQADGAVRPLVNDDDGIIFPDVTADGKTFTWSGRPGEFDVLKRYTEGGQVQVTAEAPNTDYTWSNMSEDGQHLVWTAFDRNVPDPSKPEVAVIYRDGEQQHVMQVNDGAVIPSMPQVSNHGDTMAWFTVDTSKPGSVTEVYIYERESTPQAQA